MYAPRLCFPPNNLMLIASLTGMDCLRLFFSAFTLAVSVHSTTEVHLLSKLTLTNKCPVVTGNDITEVL